MTQYPNRRNPIVQHGELEQQFVQIPNDLARDTDLSFHAYKIAIVLRTHRQGWEISRKSLADTYRWGRTTVTKAMAELVDAGWLALREYRNEDGHRLFEEFHVHVARPFTREELAGIGTTVILPAPHALDECSSVLPFDADGCIESSQDRVLDGVIKEHQIQNIIQNINPKNINDREPL